MLKRIVGIVLLSASAFAQSSPVDRFEGSYSNWSAREPDSSPFRIKIDEPPVHGGFVSLRELVIPKKAFVAFQESLRLSQSGHREEAIEKLKTAIRIYPDFWEAHSNLGAYLFAGNDVSGALTEFRAAAALRPGSALIETNIASALLTLDRTEEAEQSVRRALVMDPKYGKAQYLYGKILVLSHRQDEAIPYLEAASREVPVAAVILKQLRGAEVVVSSALQPR